MRDSAAAELRTAAKELRAIAEERTGRPRKRNLLASRVLVDKARELEAAARNRAQEG